TRCAATSAWLSGPETIRARAPNPSTACARAPGTTASRRRGGARWGNATTTPTVARAPSPRIPARPPPSSPTHPRPGAGSSWPAEWWVGFGHIPWFSSLGHIALPALAVYGAHRAWRPGIGFLVLALLAFSLPYALTLHGHGRSRVPVEPLLCLLAALPAATRQPDEEPRA